MLSALEAELYALTHRGNAGDAEFYASVCAGAAGVLELGTGYGRLLPSLAQAAQSVVGLDREPSLLRQAERALAALPAARRSRVQLARGDMRAFDLGKRFERIILPYNACYCLLSRRELARCFAAVAQHLSDDGRFVFDVWSADPFARNPRSAAHRDDESPIISLSHRGRVWDVFERSRLRSARQRLDVSYSYVPRGRGNAVEILISQRYARSAELVELLADAGLAVEALWGDFGGSRFGPRSVRCVVQAKRASNAGRVEARPRLRS